MNSSQNQSTYEKYGTIDDWTIILKLFTIKHNNNIKFNIGLSPNNLIFGINFNDFELIEKLDHHLYEISNTSDNYEYIKYIKYYKIYKFIIR